MTDQDYNVAEYMQRKAEARFGSLGVDQLFREFDASDLDRNAVKFPVTFDGDELTDEEARKMGPDEKKNVLVGFNKYGFEGNGQSERDDLDEMFDWMFAAMAHSAVDEVYESVARRPDGNGRSRQMANTTWSWDADAMEILDTARRRASEEQEYYYDTDVLLVSSALADKITNAYMNHSWGEVVSNYTDSHDIVVVTDDYNLLRGGDVIAVDTDLFGYQCVREYPAVREYTEYENYDPRFTEHHDDPDEDEKTVLQEVKQVYCRTGYGVIDQNAAHITRFARV